MPSLGALAASRSRPYPHLHPQCQPRLPSDAQVHPVSQEDSVLPPTSVFPLDLGQSLPPVPVVERAHPLTRTQVLSPPPGLALSPGLKDSSLAPSTAPALPPGLAQPRAMRPENIPSATVRGTETVDTPPGLAPSGAASSGSAFSSCAPARSAVRNPGLSRDKSTQRLRILDPFCGAGGHVIAFAHKRLRGQVAHVVGLDVDPVKIALAKHNASIYGVEDRITLVCADITAWAPLYAKARRIYLAALDEVGGGRGRKEAALARVTADPELGGEWRTYAQWNFDIICTSPPWGGVDYQLTPHDEAPGTLSEAIPSVLRVQDPPDPAPVSKAEDQAHHEHHRHLSAAEKRKVKRQRAKERKAEAAALEAGVHASEKEDERAAEAPAAELTSTRQGPVASNPPDVNLQHLGTALPSASGIEGKAAQQDKGLYRLSRLAPLGGDELMSLFLDQFGVRNVALFIPRNSHLGDLVSLGRMVGEACRTCPPRGAPPSKESDANGLDYSQVVVEHEFSRHKLIAVTAFFGGLGQRLPDERDALPASSMSPSDLHPPNWHGPTPTGAGHLHPALHTHDALLTPYNFPQPDSAGAPPHASTVTARPFPSPTRARLDKSPVPNYPSVQ